MTTSGPVQLTDVGWRYLQQQLDEYQAALALLKQRRDEDPSDVQDTGDESVRIQESDDETQVSDRVADLREWLDEAVALQPPADPNRVSLGSKVHVRWANGEEEDYRIVHPAEVGASEIDVSVDAPVARALLDQPASATVAVHTPDGEQHLTLLTVEPYRPG
jgi:transcription elongation GreA/GreB family factor